jgi:hypothetical protein
MPLLKTFTSFFIIIFFALFTGYAGQPLITDDTGTEGTNGLLFEFETQIGYQKEDDFACHFAEIPLTLTYGIADKLDAVLQIPYFRLWTADESNVHGLLDIFFELKWQFYNMHNTSFAIKPGLTIPTGNNRDNLGAGKATFGIVFVGTHSFENLSVYYNLGYLRNENMYRERIHLWQISLASEFALSKKLTVVADLGLERNSSFYSRKPPGFLLTGFTYTITDGFMLDAGFKTCLNQEATEYSILTGITVGI